MPCKVRTLKLTESEEWSSQWIFQFKQLERRSLKKKKKKIRASTGFEPVTSALINLCRQLALDGVVDTDVDFKSDGAVSSPTYYLLFSLFSYLKTLSYKTPIMYFEGMWPSDFGVSVLVTTGAWQIRAESSRVFGYQIHLVQEGVKVWWTFFQDARAETIMTCTLVASHRFKDIRNLHFRN